MLPSRTRRRQSGSHPSSTSDPAFLKTPVSTTPLSGNCHARAGKARRPFPGPKDLSPAFVGSESRRWSFVGAKNLSPPLAKEASPAPASPAMPKQNHIAVLHHVLAPFQPQLRRLLVQSPPPVAQAFLPVQHWELVARTHEGGRRPVALRDWSADEKRTGRNACATEELKNARYAGRLETHEFLR